MQQLLQCTFVGEALPSSFGAALADPDTSDTALTLVDIALTSHDSCPAAAALPVAGDRAADELESTVGGDTTCIICMTNPKTHLAAPCGHQYVCCVCSYKLEQCPYCREPAIMWVKHHMV